MIVEQQIGTDRLTEAGVLGTYGAPLSREALATLQFVARGYSASEIAQARRRPMADVISELRATVDALGAVTVREAIGVAMRRGLVF